MKGDGLTFQSADQLSVLNLSATLDLSAILAGAHHFSITLSQLKANCAGFSFNLSSLFTTASPDFPSVDFNLSGDHPG